jgi:hypothetical protein
MTLTWHRADRRSLGALDGVALVGLITLLVARFIPVARILPFWGCPLRRMTGFPCLSCGMTRAFDRVAHFNFAGAFDANPLGALGAISLGLLVVFAAVSQLFRLPRPAVQLSDREGYFGRWALVVAVAANWGYVIVRTLSA